MSRFKKQYEFNIVKSQKNKYCIVRADGVPINKKYYSEVELFNFQRHEFDPLIEYPTDVTVDYIFAVKEPANWKNLKKYYSLEFANILTYILGFLYIIILRIKASLNLLERWRYINKEGEAITDAIYDEPFAFINGRALAKINGKWGVLDETGFAIVPITFDRVNYIYNYEDYGEKSNFAFIQVWLANRTGLYSLYGKPLIPPVYYQLLSINWKAIEILIKNHSFPYGYLVEIEHHSEIKKVPIRNIIGKLTKRHFFISFSESYTDYNYIFCEEGEMFEKIIFDKFGYHSEFDFLRVSYRSGIIRLTNSRKDIIIDSTGKISL